LLSITPKKKNFKNVPFYSDSMIEEIVKPKFVKETPIENFLAEAPIVEPVSEIQVKKAEIKRDTTEIDKLQERLPSAANCIAGQKRRGRKRIRDDQYFIRAHATIKKFKEQLHNAKETGLTVKERNALRNKVSAQNARLRKKHESIFLVKVVDEKDSKMASLIDSLTEILSPDDLKRIYSKVSQKWQEEDEELGNSKPIKKISKNGIMHPDVFRSALTDNFITRQSELDKFK
jgi:hypothetical protein